MKKIIPALLSLVCLIPVAAFGQTLPDPAFIPTWDNHGHVARAVSISQYHTTADGSDYGPSLARAVTALSASPTGGALYFPAGTYTFSSQAVLLKSAVPIRIFGDGCSSVIKAASGFTSPMINLGNNVAGGTNISFDHLQFTGTNTLSAKAVNLEWGNSTEFDHVCWQNLLLGVTAHDSYGVSIVNSPLILNIGDYVFLSSTTAHDFHFINNKGFNIGTIAGIETGGTVRIDGPGTFNIVLRENDLEGFTYLANINGAYNPVIADNYFEQASDSLIIAPGTIYGATITNNTISIGAAWTLTGFSGGRFENNSINGSQVVTLANAGAPGMVGQNKTVGGGTMNGPAIGTVLGGTYSSAAIDISTATTSAKVLNLTSGQQTQTRTDIGLGSLVSSACSTNQFVNGVTTGGLPTCATPTTGSSTAAAGSSGQFQTNNAGSLAGVTISGDVAISGTTGVATLSASKFPGLSASVEATGTPGLDNGQWFIYHQPTTPSAGLVDTFRVDRNANYTGGSPSGNLSAIWANCTAGAAVANFEWCQKITLDDLSTTSAQNVGLNVTTTRHSGTGPLWTTNFVCQNLDGEVNPTGSCIPGEVDLFANGTDNNHQRWGWEIILGRPFNTGAAVTATGAIWLNPGASSTFQNGIYFDSGGVGYGVAGGGGSFATAINMGNAVITNAALALPNNARIAFDSDTVGNFARSLRGASGLLVYSTTSGDVFSINDTGVLSSGGTAGVTCASVTAATVTVKGGIVTHC